ncbi:lipase/esterase [Cadophora sp. DSE1049]|nr:lipase/esterase [Cadophora sp. DSE1049]
MAHLKSQDEAIALPKPKYGHLSAIHPDFEQIKEAVETDFAALWELPVEELIARWRTAPPALLKDSPIEGKDITIDHKKVPVRDSTEIEIRIYKPIEPMPNALLLFNAHGGGWVLGNHGIEEGQNRLVAAENKAVVVSADYRMAPEFKFPYAIDDCFDVLKWCKSNASTLGINPETIVVSGGSAGGNIAAVLAQKTRDEKVTGVIGQVLNIPVTCHPNHFPRDEFEYGSYEQNAQASMAGAPKLLWFWNQYLPNGEPHTYASPLLAKNFRNLPPALIQIAGADPLRDEGFAYAEKLIHAGVRTTVKVYPGLPHGFYLFPQLDAAREYLQEVSNFVRGLQRYEVTL